MKHAYLRLAFVFLILTSWGCGDETVCSDPYNNPSTTPCETTNDCSNVNCNNVCSAVEADSLGSAFCSTSVSLCSCQFCASYDL
jgi:hypothetical protein